MRSREDSGGHWGRDRASSVAICRSRVVIECGSCRSVLSGSTSRRVVGLSSAGTLRRCWLLQWQAIRSPLLGNSPACPNARGTGGRLQPRARSSSGGPCHPRTRPPKYAFASWLAALNSEQQHRFRLHRQHRSLGVTLHGLLRSTCQAAFARPSR
jgi:hypothetical protein